MRPILVRMTTGLPDIPPSAGDASERMQRVRVGITGLAAVVLVVTVATAIATSVRKSATESAAVSGPPPVVATINASDAKTEPLAQLGMTPDAKDVPAPPAKKTN
jgi:hypothetical protein